MILAITLFLSQAQTQPAFHSKVAIFDMKSRKSTVVFEQDGIVEAPNWSRDGKFLLVNTAGSLFRLAPTVGAKLDDPAILEHAHPIGPADR